MLMPEAAVNEDSQPATRQDEIGKAGKIFPVQAEAETQPVRDLANHELRSGVRPLIPAIISLRRRLSTMSTKMLLSITNRLAGRERPIVERCDISISASAMREAANPGWVRSESRGISEKTGHERDAEG